MINDLAIIENFLVEKERQELAIFLAEIRWVLEMKSYKVVEGTDKIFWGSFINSPQCIDFFYKKIESFLKQKVEILAIKANGQSHGQCGAWHPDIDEVKEGEDINQYFSLVYFPYDWLPEYGGHLIIDVDKTTSILPEFNKAVIFKSNIFHVGLEPTVHCKTLRVSIACTFKVIN